MGCLAAASGAAVGLAGLLQVDQARGCQGLERGQVEAGGSATDGLALFLEAAELAEGVPLAVGQRRPRLRSRSCRVRESVSTGSWRMAVRSTWPGPRTDLARHLCVSQKGLEVLPGVTSS